MNRLERTFWRMAMKDEADVVFLSKRGKGLEKLCAKMVLVALDEEAWAEDFPGQKRNKNGQFGKGKMPGSTQTVAKNRKHGKIEYERRRIPLDGNGTSFTMPRAGNVTQKEAAKVQHEINALYHSKYKDEPFCLITTYSQKDGKAYDFRFENHGFNEYNIYSKRRNRK